MTKEIRWDTVHALFGGSFDPPHRGHLEAVQGLLQNPGVAKVWILPSGNHPFKNSTTSAQHCLAMTKLTFKNQPGTEVSDYEVLNAVQDQPTYTYQTLLDWKQKLSPLAFVIGSDQLENFSQWARFPDILGYVHWIILNRKEGNDDSLRVLQQWKESNLMSAISGRSQSWMTRIAGQSPTQIRLVETPARAISSSEVRRQYALTGKPPESAILPAVQDYLKVNHLYGN